MHRVFFALYPDNQIRDQLSNLTHRISEQNCVKPANLHLTLHFIGHTGDLNCLIKQATEIRCNPFELCINQFGIFNRAKVLWAGPKECPGELSQLANDCFYVTTQCGIDNNVEQFKPHISLIQRIKSFPDLADFEPIKWQINKFCLMLSEPDDNGVQYSLVETFPLHL